MTRRFGLARDHIPILMSAAIGGVSLTERHVEPAERNGRGFGYAPIVHAVFLCLALAATWLALSGYFTPLLLGLGAASIALSVFIAMRMDLIDHEGVPVQLGPRTLLYWCWLLKEIVKANLDVARRVMQREPDISPVLLDIPMEQMSEVGQVTYANSITLTPGTVAVVLDPGVITVHALTQAAADDLAAGEMGRRVGALER